MRSIRFAALLGIGLFCASFASAQRVVVGVGVGPGYYGPAYVGPPPVCAYGYYDYYPYACAPYGFYGPDYFVNGVFVGVGPWYHWYYRHPGWYRRGFYGRGYDGRGYYGRGWDRDDWRGRGFRGDWDHDGWRRDWDHDRGRGREWHGDHGWHGDREFHGHGHRD
ncbi:MAG TPA: hypothetical protein VKB90_11110 [Candidatus Acidoferrum sp.]|nr:hypothetical protein [Candidatus Acidoferrum sp.]